MFGLSGSTRYTTQILAQRSVQYTSYHFAGQWSVLWSMPDATSTFYCLKIYNSKNILNLSNLWIVTTELSEKLKLILLFKTPYWLALSEGNTHLKYFYCKKAQTFKLLLNIIYFIQYYLFSSVLFLEWYIQWVSESVTVHCMFSNITKTKQKN